MDPAATPAPPLEAGAVGADGDLQQRVLARAEALAALEVAAQDVAAVELLGELEALKNTIAAVQARAAVALKASRVAERAEQPAAVRERGIGAEVALARRESPHRGGVHLGLAVVVCAELPHTLAAMEAGWCSEWRATQIAQGTACLSLADRQAIDAALMADAATTHGWGDRRFRAEVDRRAYAADPAAALARHTRAVAERHTSIRPAADGMVRLSGLLPLAQGISVHATLSRAADTARASGDPRTRGQVMADTLVQRVTGANRPRSDRADEDGESTAPPVVPAAVHVTLSDAVLLGVPGQAGDQAGWISGPGVAPVPLPADVVRDLLARADRAGLATLRRLFARPADGQLVAMESAARTFPAGLAAFLTARDRTCRTPWCDAPVRHLDHVTAHAEGGTTSAENGQGTCEGCNYTKQAPGWTAQLTRAAELADGLTEELARVLGRHLAPTVTTTTPTGHTHHSRAPGVPPPLAPDRPPGLVPRVELQWAA